MSIGVLGHMGFFVLAVGICSSSRFKSRRVLLLHDPHQQRAGVELQAGCTGRQEELRSTSEQRLPTEQMNLRSSLPRSAADQQLARRTVE
ncbi:unnamed protein product [Sphagnum balticum]